MSGKTVTYQPAVLTEIVRQATDPLRATIAGLRAEVAAIKARPAMAWRRREEDETLPVGRYLVSLDLRSGPRVVQGEMKEGESMIQVWSSWYDPEKVTHYIPWSDLTPPGGEDAS